MTDVAGIVLKLTPAQIRLLKALRPVPGAKGTFTYPTKRGIRAALQSGWAMFRRGLVEPDPVMKGCIQQHECGQSGFIVLSALGRRVHAEVNRADL